MKWLQLVIGFALNLKYVWVQDQFIEWLNSAVDEEGLNDDEQQFSLCIDEMSVKNGLVFNKHTRALVGFTDLTSVNSDFRKLTSHSGVIELTLADKVLVFMAWAIFRASISYPIAHYPSSHLFGSKLYPLVWEAIEALKFYKLPVISITGMEHQLIILSTISVADSYWRMYLSRWKILGLIVMFSSFPTHLIYWRLWEIALQILFHTNAAAIWRWKL